MIELEKLSKFIHEEMWAKWALELLETEDISRERSLRWKELFVPYEKLSEQMKDLDRMFAIKILELNNNSNSYLNDRKAIDRLKKEYGEHGNLIIGFDYDCTIFDYHNEGLELQPVIDLLKKCSDLGFTMCLHSLTIKNSKDGSSGDKLSNCVDLGIGVQYINFSPIMPAYTQENANRSKPFYSILLDDRAGLSSAYNILKTTLEELNL